jgi:hypothetical protein
MACNQTAAINTAYVTSTERAGEMVPALDAMVRNLTERKVQIETMNGDLQGLARSGNIGAYNAQVASYNSLVADYNRQRSRYLPMVAKYQAYAGIHNYIQSHRHDRKGTYAWVAQHPVP